MVISRNANVATGGQGVSNAREARELVAARAGVEPDELLIAFTGGIGRQYPMERVRVGLRELRQPPPLAAYAASVAAIRTTDTVANYVTLPRGAATIAGIAKGIGMIELNMATLLSFAMSRLTTASRSAPTTLGSGSVGSGRASRGPRTT